MMLMRIWIIFVILKGLEMFIHSCAIGALLASTFSACPVIAGFMVMAKIIAAVTIILKVTLSPTILSLLVTNFKRF